MSLMKRGKTSLIRNYRHVAPNGAVWKLTELSWYASGV